MLKFATFEVLSSVLVPERATTEQAKQIVGQGSAFYKTAHRAEFDYEPRPGFLYVRSRAISSRCNDNFDEFPAEEIKKAYATFVGKPVFVNHHNDNHRRMRGVIIDAALHEDRNPDGSPDTWAEVLMEVDAKSFPKLAKAIVEKHIERTSMGTDVAFSICSACNNKATSPAEYCQHIPRMKGQRLYRTTASGKKEGVLIREICYGLGFFENSLLVEPPADPTAYFLGVDTRGLDKAASLDKVAAGAGSPMGGADGSRKDRHLGRETDECAKCGSDIYRLNGEKVWQHDIDSGAGVPHQAEPGGMTQQSVGSKTAVAGPKYPDPSQHPSWQSTALHPDHVVEHYNAANPHEVAAGKSWYSDAHHLAKTIAGDHPHPKGPAHVGGGVLSAYSPQNNWPANIFAAHRSFREGRAIGPGEGPTVMGMHQRAAEKIMGGEDHQTALKGPKTQDFAHLIEHGGNAPDSDRKRVVIDRHALSVAAGRRVPKDEANALGSAMGNRHYYEHAANVYRQATDQINHGKPADEHVEPHQVQAVTWLVRQRRNAEEDDANESSAYRNRAKGRAKAEQNTRDKMQSELLEHHPDLGKGNSHVQAAKGTRKVRLRDATGETTPDGKVVTHVTFYHHPIIPGTTPQTSAIAHFDDGSTFNDNHSAWFEVKKKAKEASAAHLAYGETKAPSDVDTLRDEECPVCGEHDSYDGNRCQVCGFIAPPAMFQDPDLDMAKRLDLRKDIAQDAGSLPGQPENGGLPGEVPGETVPGSDAVPVDPSMVNPDGTVTPTTDPEQIADQQAQQLEDGEPLDPNQLGPDGQVVPPDMDAANQDFETDGKPFTPGPNMPQGPDEPGDPEGPEDPVTEQAEGVEPGQQPAADGGDPGTPDDGVADLSCPNCGFQADAAQPASTNMDLPNEPPVADGSEGMLAGDVCPNCQQAQLVSVGETNQAGLPPAV